MYCYVNGKFVLQEQATIPILDRGLLLGDGLFETLKFVKTNCEFLEAHYNRLKQSANAIDILLPFTLAKLKSIITTLAYKNQLSIATIRITITRGNYDFSLTSNQTKPNTIILTKPFLGLNTPPLKVITIPTNTNHLSSLIRLKSIAYLPNIIALKQAKSQQQDDCLFVNEQNYIQELTTANFFCVINNLLITPHLSPWVLPGITRQIILNLKHSSQEQNIALSQLPQLQEAFSCSSVRGIVPISHINNTKINNGEVGEITHQIIKDYQTQAIHSLESI